MAKFKFEEALERLEQIVRQLEEGSLGLDESLKIFDEGIKLTQACTKKLEESERKIQILLRNEQGEQSLQPFVIGDDDGSVSSVDEAEETALKNEESFE
ncbi:MAG: exodeoxyribonuclease VII small subunit [bacterium]